MHRLPIVLSVVVLCACEVTVEQGAAPPSSPRGQQVAPASRPPTPAPTALAQPAPAPAPHPAQPAPPPVRPSAAPAPHVPAGASTCVRACMQGNAPGDAAAVQACEQRCAQGDVCGDRTTEPDCGRCCRGHGRRGHTFDERCSCT